MTDYEQALDLCRNDPESAALQITVLLGKVSELELTVAKLSKNSTNSSKPPSSDITRPKSQQKQEGKRKIGAEVRAQISLMEQIGRKHLVTAGKDISNPGIIGTLGMLLEVSGKGAEIDLGLIPKPNLSENNLTFEQWVRMYPGMGFILTANKRHVGELIRLFASVGMTAHEIGSVNASRELRIRYEGKDTQVFDFIKNGIMHLSNEDVACQGR